MSPGACGPQYPTRAEHTGPVAERKQGLPARGHWRAALAAIAFLVAGFTEVYAQGHKGLPPVETDEARKEEPAAPRRVSIRFLTEADYPPFNYYDEEGVLTGFNVDMARAICLEAGATCDIQVRPWAELVPSLIKGDADAIIASLKIGPKVLAAIDFSDRYYHTPARFVARRGAGDLLVTPEGLEGKRIGVAKGTAHEAYLVQFFRYSKIDAFETPDLARDALVSAKVDLVFDDALSLMFWLNGTASRGCCEFRGGPYVEPRFFGDGIGVAVPRGDQELKRIINDSIRKVRESGRFEELTLRYFPLKVD